MVGEEVLHLQRLSGQFPAPLSIFHSSHSAHPLHYRENFPEKFQVQREDQQIISLVMIKF